MNLSSPDGGVLLAAAIAISLVLAGGFLLRMRSQSRRRAKRAARRARHRHYERLWNLVYRRDRPKRLTYRRD